MIDPGVLAGSAPDSVASFLSEARGQRWQALNSHQNMPLNMSIHARRMHVYIYIHTMVQDS